MDDQANGGQYKAAVDGAGQLQLDVDLEDAAFNHVDILSRFDQYPCLFHGKYLEEALRRYEQFWLPLASAHRDKLLAAPLDIEWVWDCHILSPVAYRNDCEKHFGGWVDHKLLGRQERDEALEVSMKLWQEKYGPEEPFKQHLPMGLQVEEGEVQKFPSQLQYDIREAIGRQATFYYNVSLSHYRDRRYLRRCLFRYKQFLYLERVKTKAFLVPCYDIDLLWHTHQLFPTIYWKDTERILGKVLNHDDSTTDRSPGSKLNISYSNTCKFWTETFGEHYHTPGAMYRGPSPRGKMSDFKTEASDDDIENLPTEAFIYCVALQTNPAGYKQKFCVSIYHTRAGTSDRTLVIVLKGPNLVWTEEHLAKARFNIQRGDQLEFVMARRTGVFIESKEEVARVTLDSTALLRHVVYRTESDFHKELDFCSTDSKNKLCIDGGVRTVTSSQVLTLNVEEFAVYAQPVDLYLQEPLQKCQEESDSCQICNVATHRLLDTSGEEVFRIRLILNGHHNLSAVQVFDMKGRLVTLANRIDSNHLPLPAQVASPGCDVSLCPANGERAFLVKDNHGDWGVIGAKWFPGSDKGDGVMNFRFYACRENQCRYVSFPDESQSLDLIVGNSSMDYKTGKIVTDYSSETPQRIATLFVFGIMTSLCVPRPDPWRPGQPIRTEATAHIPLDSSRLARACGLHVQTPSNVDHK